MEDFETVMVKKEMGLESIFDKSLEDFETVIDKKEMGLEPIFDKSLEDFEKVFVKEESALESVKLEPKELGDTQDLDELNLLDPLKEVAQ